MSNAFNAIIELIFSHEGGYINHPKDPGGETKYGISKRAYPNEDIRNLTKERAKEIYLRDYWNKIRGDILKPQIAAVVMDIAVNCGVDRAIKMLQRVAGVRDDGKFGPATERALENLSFGHVCEGLTFQRLEFYRSLPTYETFGKGWERRTIETLVFALQLRIL